jgi:hypothetical protein
MEPAHQLSYQRPQVDAEIRLGQIESTTLMNMQTQMTAAQPESVLTWDQHETVRLLRGAPGTQYQEGSDADRHIIRDWIRNLLHSTAATVTFVKSDGTVRDMRCTLNWNSIPPDQQPKTVDLTESRQRKAPSEESLRVFDLDINEWRSFRFDRLQRITATVEFDQK